MSTIGRRFMVVAAVLVVSAYVRAEMKEGSPFYPLWEPKECVRWHDELTVEEAKGRLKWARLCAPDYESYYRYAEAQGNEAGTKRPLYPVFGIYGGDDKPMNPKKYYPAVEPPAHEDRCDLPSDYVLVGLCQSLPGM